MLLKTPSTQKRKQSAEDLARRAKIRKLQGQQVQADLMNALHDGMIKIKTPGGGIKTVFTDEITDYEPDEDLEDNETHDENEGLRDTENDSEENSSVSERSTKKEKPSQIFLTETDIPLLKSLDPNEVQDFVRSCHAFYLKGYSKPVKELMYKKLYTQITGYYRDINWQDWSNDKLLDWLLGNFPTREDTYANIQEQFRNVSFENFRILDKPGLTKIVEHISTLIDETKSADAKLLKSCTQIMLKNMGKEKSIQVKRLHDLMKMEPELNSPIEFIMRLTEEASKGYKTLLDAKTWGVEALQEVIKTCKGVNKEETQDVSQRSKNGNGKPKPKPEATDGTEKCEICGHYSHITDDCNSKHPDRNNQWLSSKVKWDDSTVGKQWKDNLNINFTQFDKRMDGSDWKVQDRKKYYKRLRYQS